MFDLHKQSIERGKVQEIGASLIENNDLVLIEAATGIGKGRLCFMGIERDNSPQKWLIVVPELLQIENMRLDIIKHGFEHLYDKIEDIICYASFSKYKNRSLNLWFNEVHKLSALKEDIAQTIKYQKIIADTATLPTYVRDRLYKLGKFTTYKLSLKEAISTGVLPEPTINIIYTELDNHIKRNVTKFGRKSFSLTDLEYVKNIEKSIDYWIEKQDSLYRNGKDASWCGNKLNQLGNKRKAFLANSKTDELKKLLLYLGGKRGIVYTGSLAQCNEVGGNTAIHSKKTPKHNREVLLCFNNYEIDKLYVLKIGREGLNLEQVNFVVCVQLSSGNDEGLDTLQKWGRGLRALDPEIYVLVTKNTKDEVMLKKALKTVDSSYIKELKL